MKKQIGLMFLLAFAIGCNSGNKTNNNSMPNNNPTTQATPLPTPQPYTEKFTKTYKTMTEEEKISFVAEKSREIAKRISSNEYAFTADFEKRIKTFVDGFAMRVGSGNTKLWSEDLNIVMQRGNEFAPTINSVFDKHQISRLMGLYLCMIETEFTNVKTENFADAGGLFFIISPSAAGYGLKLEERFQPDRAADFAALYLKDRFKQFDQYSMKEVLAIVGYNRSPTRVEKDLKLVLNESNKNCSICALTENAAKLDEYFRNETIKYAPKFFAAAIVGENSQAFGLETKPLSTL